MNTSYMTNFYSYNVKKPCDKLDSILDVMDVLRRTKLHRFGLVLNKRNKLMVVSSRWNS